MKRSIRQVYNYLSSKADVKVPADFREFELEMADPKKQQAVKKYLQEDGCLDFKSAMELGDTMQVKT